MIFAIYNGLDARWKGSEVQLGSLGCSFIVKEGPIGFLSVEGVGELLDKYCRGFVSRGIALQLFGVMPLQ